MVFNYKLESAKCRVWAGTSGFAQMGSFIDFIPEGFGGVREIRQLKQIHGNSVYTDSLYTDSNHEGDGLITSQRCTLLTIRTADCIPVFFAGEEFVGLIHAGWRSLKAGILEKAVFHMGESPFIVVIGPSIFAENYEVDRDLYENWKDPDISSYLLPHKGTKRLLNLRGLAVQVLKRSGVPGHSIYNIPLCTYRDGLPSYRKNGLKAGRMVNYIFQTR